MHVIRRLIDRGRQSRPGLTFCHVIHMVVQSEMRLTSLILEARLADGCFAFVMSRVARKAIEIWSREGSM
jgi:hypothetical protein